MKIKEVNDECIEFDNGNCIEYRHYQECCEENYADFKAIDEIALDTEFDEDLLFEPVEDAGFRFGSKNTQRFFIPCYSAQNGYYSSSVEIYYNDEQVLCTDGRIL